jgi:hypothetical protein
VTEDGGQQISVFWPSVDRLVNRNAEFCRLLTGKRFSNAFQYGFSSFFEKYRHLK